jgi:hypothetical protein
LLVDKESKFGPFDGPTAEVEAAKDGEASKLSVLILEEDGRKVFVAPTNAALAIRQLREAMDFFFHLSVRAVDASHFPDSLVKAIGLGIGYPIQNPAAAQQSPSLSATTATNTPGSVLSRGATPSWSCAFSDDEGDSESSVEPELEMIPLTSENIGRVQEAFGDLAIFDRTKKLHVTENGPAVGDSAEASSNAPLPATAASSSPVPAEGSPNLLRKEPSRQSSVGVHLPIVDPSIVAVTSKPAPAFFDPAIASMTATLSSASRGSCEPQTNILALLAAGRRKGSSVPSPQPVAINDSAVISVAVAVPFTPTTEAIDRAAVCFTRDADDEDEDDIVVMRPGELDH